VFPHQGSGLFPGFALDVHDGDGGRTLAGHLDRRGPADALASACDQADSVG
jgi:hypothetical protein